MDERHFTAEQAAAVTTAMRRQLGLEPQRFSPPEFVGMVSDEIEMLRERGLNDDAIAALLREAGAAIDAADIGRYYVGPEERSANRYS